MQDAQDKLQHYNINIKNNYQKYCCKQEKYILI